MKRDSRCKTCQHPEWKEINKKINAGWILKEIAEEYDLSYDSLTNHARQGHYLEDIQQLIVKKKETAVMLSPETQKMVRKELQTDFDAVNASRMNLELINEVVQRSMKRDKELGGVSGKTITVLAEQSKAIHRHDKAFGKALKHPEVQVSIYMPALAKLVEYFPGPMKKQFYDVLQNLTEKEFDAVVDIPYEMVEEEEGVEIKIENRKED